MDKAGQILKIIVHDFVTYNHAELIPGPNLNMIIGPNGTGKSTIVAAIILGLGGNPKTVGRGTKISEYVKHNCNESTIEIHLRSKTPNEHISIKRNFDLHDKSVWYLNGRKVGFQDVAKTIKVFNIQVDNLCQFLPQDRVQDFAKMDKKQLLLQTQVAICRLDLVDKQKQLIEIQERHKELQASAEKSTQKLQELHDANVRIESKIKNMKKKEKYTKHIENIDRKTAWLEYEKFRAKRDEIKEDKKKAMDIFNKHKEAAVPIEKAIKNANQATNRIRATLDSKQQDIKQKENRLQSNLSKQAELKQEVRKILGDKASRISEVERKRVEIAAIKEELNNLSRNKDEILISCGDENQRKQKLGACNDNLKNISSHLSKFAVKKGDLENSKQTKMYELRALESDLRTLENIKQQRLAWLQKRDRDAYNAVLWLRSNKHMFKGEIYEPMVLELNVLNPQHARFIENIIPFQDKVAFTCVYKEDMNLLIRKLRDQQNLSVNVLLSQSAPNQFHSYRPKIPIEELMPFGLFSYAHSLFTGPEPIMTYLCKNYQIHNVPVGDHITNEQYQNVPPQITKFFSNKYRFVTSYSRYTRDKSTRQTEITSDGSLGISLNAERMEHIRGQICDIQNACQKYDNEIATANIEIEQLNEKQSTIRNNIRQLQSSLQTIQGIDSRIRVAQNKLQNTQKISVTVEQIEVQTKKALENLTQHLLNNQHKLLETFKMYSTSISEIELDKTNVNVSQKQVMFLENKFEDIRQLRKEAEQTLNKVKQSFEIMQAEARTALQKAKQLSNGFVPTDEGFIKEFQETYDNLSDNLEELANEKDEVLGKIDCLNTADSNEFREYQERLDMISKLENSIKNRDSAIEEVNTNMNELHREWMEPLQEVINAINDKFSDAFNRLGCVGEVSVFTGENEREFSEYGLSIKVKYRSSEPLQELNHVIQSGGERAVATAAYMLSLQELTPVPFRCVDEINQGMDANNERRIFKLLVEATTRPDTSQYFFITPKLVPKLKFVPSMKIHFVHNGPYVPKHKKWNRVLAAAKEAAK